MSQLQNLEPARVFHYFEEISAVPRGSGNRKGIADYCEAFAQTHGLKAVRDAAHNVVIYKPATAGYEQADTVILQGHLDIVCQKTDEVDIDFDTDGLQLLVEGDFVTANGTTLGADNGIAVAMILSILESTDIPHPTLEAVFTADEEIGMLGAMELNMQLLSGKKMINLDAEEEDTLTVSCAGGSDFVMTVPLTREAIKGDLVTIRLKGLSGGHSGVEIHKGRVNADILAGRVLNHLYQAHPFRIVSIDGGDKANAIPSACCIQLCVPDAKTFVSKAVAYCAAVQEEIKDREPRFTVDVTDQGTLTASTFSEQLTKQLIFTLLCTPNGVIDMSAQIEGLVETSLNLGILKTEETAVTLHFALRSNKQATLAFLEEKMHTFATQIPCTVKRFGHYPPWEFNDRSSLQEIFKTCYAAQRGCEPNVAAIHAGLECGVFASGIPGLDCIAMGPALYDVHTTSERLSIPSTERTYQLLQDILKNCK